MTYIDYMNQLWRVAEQESLPASEVALYVYLVNECNRHFWKMPVACTSIRICETLRYSKQTLVTARQHLASLGLLKFTKGSARFAPSKYALLDLTEELTDNLTEELTDDLTEELTDDLTSIKNKDKDQNILKRETSLAIPTFAQINDFMQEYTLQNKIPMKQDLPGIFYDYYQSNGWKIGSNPMSDWQAAARRWLNDPRNLNLKKDDDNKPNTKDFRSDNRSSAKDYAAKLEQRAILTAGAA